MVVGSICLPNWQYIPLIYTRYTVYIYTRYRYIYIYTRYILPSRGLYIPGIVLAF